MATTRRSKKPNKATKARTLEELSIPNHFRCPISLDLMRDPVTVSTGITYDRESIETWLDGGNSTCPVTNQELVVDEIIPNHSLRRLIQDWCVANRSHGVERIPTPKIPITAAQASLILSEIPTANRARTPELVARVARLAKESERNRKCLQDSGAGAVLAALFSDSTGLDETMILSTLALFVPLGHEACLHLGSRHSLTSIASILRFGDLGSRLNAAVIIKEVLAAGNREIVRIASETDGLTEALMELIRRPISPRATKASLAASFILISSDDVEKSSTTTASKFVDLGLVPLLLELLIDSDKSTCDKALMVFDAVCGCERGREAAYGHALTVPVLVKKMFRISDAATGLVVSALWRLCKNHRDESKGVLVEAIQVGAFQKLLLLLQVGCSAGVKEKATELLKLMNGSRENGSKEKLDCVDAVDFRGLKRSL